MVISLATEARKRANKKWQEKHYDQLLIRVPKGYKTRIFELINNGTEQSINNYVKKLIEADLLNRNT